jgi:hypothetical protein
LPQSQGERLNCSFKILKTKNRGIGIFQEAEGLGRNFQPEGKPSAQSAAKWKLKGPP